MENLVDLLKIGGPVFALAIVVMYDGSRVIAKLQEQAKDLTTLATNHLSHIESGIEVSNVRLEKIAVVSIVLWTAWIGPMTEAEELLVFAKTVWGEARGEDLQGAIGVAYTIKHRTERDRWPNNYVDVCLQPWQFSVWNPNDPNLKKMIGLPLKSKGFQRAVFVVLGVTLGLLPDPTKGSDHYHHKSLSPYWAAHMTETVELGSHVFYNTEE